MNYRMIARILGMVLLILAALLVLPLIAGLCYGENVLNFAVTIAAAAALTSSTFPTRIGVRKPSFFRRAADSRMRASLPSV